MGHRLAEGTLAGRPFRVDVDPVRVEGRVGEPVDLVLADREPVRDGDLLADAAGLPMRASRNRR